MNRYWTQPSLSRDFALLSTAIVFLLFLISAWVTFTTFAAYSERIASDLEKEGQRIGYTFSTEMDNANYMLMALGKQIVFEGDKDLPRLAKIIKSFDSNEHIYTALSWIDAEQRIVISSNVGILEKPVDVSDRDYINQSTIEPWKMYIGQPIEGRVSNRYVLPVTMGLTDYTGKFLGTLLISVDITTLTEHLNNQIRQKGTRFLISNKNLVPLLRMSADEDFNTAAFSNADIEKNKNGLLKQGNLFFGEGSYFYFYSLAKYPYVALIEYELRHGNEIMYGILWSRLLQLFVIALFFVLFLWMMRTRMIRPVLEITAAASALSRGKPYESARVSGPEEILALSEELTRVSNYIHENKRVEEELRNKLYMLKQAKDAAEIATRSKSEFLAYTCQEIRATLNHVIGFSQSMRDQLHGPIENRKYRQYAADIYSMGSTLLGYTQDLLSFSKVETGYVTLNDRPLDLQEIINKTLRFMADKMQSEKRNIKTRMQEPLPRLLADEFRLQQIITNMLLYLFKHTAPEQSLLFRIEVVSENRERMYYSIVAANENYVPQTAAELASWAEDLFIRRNAPLDTNKNAENDIHLELIRSLAALHGAQIGVRAEGKSAAIAVFFPTNRIRFSDSGLN